MKKLIMILALTTLVSSVVHASQNPVEISPVASPDTIEDAQAFWETGAISPALSAKIKDIQISNLDMSKEEALDSLISDSKVTVE